MKKVITIYATELNQSQAKVKVKILTRNEKDI